MLRFPGGSLEPAADAPATAPVLLDCEGVGDLPG